jgi:hypothetical protein
MSRARVANYRDTHDADGAGTRYQDILCEDIKGQGRVNRVAEGIEDRSDFLIDIGMMTPNIGHGQGDEFGEGSGTVYTDS